MLLDSQKSSVLEAPEFNQPYIQVLSITATKTKFTAKLVIDVSGRDGPQRNESSEATLLMWLGFWGDEEALATRPVKRKVLFPTYSYMFPKTSVFFHRRSLNLKNSDVLSD